ncbi:hypothetical protein VaNZ11_016269 [Volvox africanus]|uniref:Reverse transcriptase Ty1/copia-type domain-containing protein n=1 Tax=Volvox africanus TaxID=51714 RepID=A0ABQ5SP54_9CHLO|nr:hypothetical protein VaNZ11_016269 [Volvox africanus]
MEDCDEEEENPLIDASDSDSDEDESDLEFEDNANENEEIVGASPGGDGDGSLSEDPNIGSGSNSGTAGDSPEASPELARAARVNWGIPRERLNLAVVARQPEVPRTYDEAMASSASQMWKQAMDEKIASLRANQVWTLEELPKGVRALPVKWVFTIKRDVNGEIVRYKARLVAKGFAQVEGRDFDEVFAPVSKHTTLRVLMALVAAADLELHQMDMKTAFLNGILEEEVYVLQPRGYGEGNQQKVCRLQKSLYGLKQAPRAWYVRLREELEQMGFQVSQADPGLFLKDVQGERVYVLVYVDDLLVAAKSMATLNAVKNRLMSAFDIRDLGEARVFLGYEIERNRTEHTLKLSLTRFITELVAKYGLEEANPRKVPLSKALRAVGERLDVQQFPYGELVGSLLYLSVGTRPDISYSVGALSRYMSKPTVEHWQAAKGVLRYLIGTNVGISYSAKSSVGTLHGYCDSDYAGCVDTRRSTTGYVFLLTGGAVGWASRLQATVATSTAEAEYMASGAATKEALWFRHLARDLKLRVPCVPIQCDNQAALKMSSNLITTPRSKHIDVLYHFVREHAARGEVKFLYCKSEDMVADVFTKPLPFPNFSKFVRAMGVC